MHNLGKPQRGLFIVEGAGSLPAVPRAVYNADEKQLGELRTVYQASGHWCGVAILKTRFAKLGEMLHLEGGQELALRSKLREGVGND